MTNSGSSREMTLFEYVELLRKPDNFHPHRAVRDYEALVASDSRRGSEIESLVAHLLGSGEVPREGETACGLAIRVLTEARAGLEEIRNEPRVQHLGPATTDAGSSVAIPGE